MANIIKYLLTQRTALALILVNIIPLIGVLYFDWQLFILVFLYWLENVVIGAFSALKMLGAYQAPFSEKVFKTSFFSIHYGFFCFIHGSILISLFGNSDDTDLHIVEIISDNELSLALVALIISHGFSFLQNFILDEERKQQSLSELMVAPYKRIIVLHLFIIVGALILTKFGETQFGLLALAFAKIVIDLIAHQSEHKKLKTKATQNLLK